MKHTCSIALALCAAACSPGPETVPPVPSSEVASAQSSSPLGGVEPVANWKSERKRIAMLGLRYDGSSVERVDSEAQSVLTGLSAADLPRLIEEATAEYEANRQLDAIATWTQVALLEPAEADHYFHLGLALRGFKLESQAHAAFQHGLRLQPDHVELSLSVANLEWGAAEFDQAVERYGAVLDIDENNVDAWGRLARAHFYAERDSEAWDAIHRTQDLGGRIPAQMIALLSARTPDPTR